MAVPSTQVLINEDQQRSIILYATKCQELLRNQFSLRAHLEEIDRYYMREDDYNIAEVRARMANKGGDKDKMQDITVPIVMPQVETAAAYMTNVFLTGYPIFGVVADPNTENEALQLETIVAENSITAGWKRQLLMFFRDGLKYNMHGLEVNWDTRNIWDIETDPRYPNGAKPRKNLWQGNCLKRMDMYNTFFDPRVHPAEIHSEGEYVGYIELYSRIRMKKFTNDLYGKVSPQKIIEALQSTPSQSVITNSTAPFGYYQPIINPYPLMDRQNLQSFDWLAWASNVPTTKIGMRYGNVYQIMKLYCRLIPQDFGLDVPEANTPQVWKFVIVNGAVVLIAERQTNIHNYIPIIFGQPMEDGLDYQTKSFASNVQDMQDVATTMWKGYIASKRRLVGDRVIYDPMRIRKVDIESTNPAAKIPVRPSAYGKGVGEAVFAFPYHDEATQTLLDGATRVNNFAYIINGQNPATQGQFVKGNKTQHEYEDVMGHGNDRNQMMAISTEEQVFTPIKEIIKLNILQYQPEAVLFNRDKAQQVNVKPVDLRKAAAHFKVSDGLTPDDKLINGDEFQTVLQVWGSSQQVAAGYNVADAFSYMMKTRGLDLTPFQKSPAQQQYEQALSAWQQAAAMAAKAGSPFSSPQPQPSQQLQQEMQQRQQGGQLPDNGVGAALESTIGDGSDTSQQQQGQGAGNGNYVPANVPIPQPKGTLRKGNGGGGNSNGVYGSGNT